MINGDVIHGLCDLIVYIINFMYIRFGNDGISVNVMDLAQSQSHNNKIVSLNNAITLFYKYAP